MFNLLNLVTRASVAVGDVIRYCNIVRIVPDEHEQKHDLHPPRDAYRENAPFAHPTSNQYRPSPPSYPKPLCGTKRNAPASFSSLSRVKRQDNGHSKQSPWSKEPWIQRIPTEPSSNPRHSDLGRKKKWCAKKTRPTHHARIPYPTPRSLSPDSMPQHRIGFRPPSSPDLQGRGRFPKPARSYLYTIHDEMSQEQEQSLDTEIDEALLQDADFTILKPREGGDTVPPRDRPGSDSIPRAPEKEELTWDQQDDEDYRQLLRNQSESHDDEGYRVPIDGVISPPSKRWNEEHRKKLHREAALEQQTPSRIPHSDTSTSLSSQSIPWPEQDVPPTSSEEDSEDPLSLDMISKQDKPATKRDGRRREPRSSLHSASHEDSRQIPDSKTKAEEDTEPSDLPLLLLENLSLEHSSRTPKSSRFEQAKSDRIAQTKQLAAEKEAAKNAYPLIPLSESWDARVRQAVNHGHKSFEARSFNRCVPWYAAIPGSSSWLDDAVINDYLTMVAKHGSRDDQPGQVRSVVALSSYLFTKISAPKPDYAACSRMLKRAGVPAGRLLECGKLLLPINKAQHWTLAVIEPKIPEGADLADQKRKLTVYNSMGAYGDQGAVAMSIMNWIKHELGADFHKEEWVVDSRGQSPQQRNSDDCGVFTCTTGRQIMLGKYQDVKDRYGEGDIRDMRIRIVAELVNENLLGRDV